MKTPQSTKDLVDTSFRYDEDFLLKQKEKTYEFFGEFPEMLERCKIFFGKMNYESQIFRCKTDKKKDDVRGHLYIYTTNNYYCFSVAKENGKFTYMGGGMGNRKPRAGEDHSRGSDIADGPYSKDTFDKIIRDIFSIEIVPLLKK